jgi:hypothetical protein
MGFMPGIMPFGVLNFSEVSIFRVTTRFSSRRAFYIPFPAYRDEIGGHLICERCSKQVFQAEKCNYCSRFVCESCEKSAKRVKKTSRYVICKDCWSNTALRGKFKSV